MDENTSTRSWEYWMNKLADKMPSFAPLEIPLERDSFLRDLLRHLTGTLQDVVGLEDASGFVSVVGQHLGRKINDDYKQALHVEKLTRDQVEEVLLDLKARIQGDFYILEKTSDKIVFGNRRCPFADQVADRPSLCMMTSNVFGTISADNLGYAKVILEDTIATGSPQCRVVVYLKPSQESEVQEGNEYYAYAE